MLVSDRLAEPFADTDEQFLHGYTFAGHPVSCVALANLDLFERQDFLGNVMANETYFRARSTISAISRSSETSAAWATSMASSWSRILKPRRPLPVTRRNTCCGVLIEPTRRTRVAVPSRCPRRAGDPALAAAHRWSDGIRHHEPGDPSGPHRGDGGDGRVLVVTSRCWWTFAWWSRRPNGGRTDDCCC